MLEFGIMHAKKKFARCPYRNQKLSQPKHEEMYFMPYANNKGAGQPAHPHSLISAFVVCCLDSC